MQFLSVSTSIFNKFRIEANSSGGAEVCAVMVGKSGSFSGQVEEIRMIRNAAKEAERGFIMDPQEFHDDIIDTTLYDDVGDTQYLGIIHSHYFDRAFPSIADWVGAVGGLYHGPYLIYSVIHEELHGFYWNGKEFVKMELIT